MDDLLVDFLADAHENIDGFDTAFVAFSKCQNDLAAFRKMLRHLHTIKGACSFLDLPDIAENAHACELLLMTAEQDNFNGFDKSAPQILARIDAIRAQVKAVQSEENLPNVPCKDIAFDAVLSPLLTLVTTLNVELSKDITLKVEGGDIRLPLQMCSPIKNALIHLVRNAATHGIEACDARKKRGKLARGSIQILIQKGTNGYIITFKDDGAGLDKQRILNAIIAREDITESDANARIDEDIYTHIFKSGITTCDEVNMISGQGIGLDIVRHNIQSIGGTIQVDSQANIGTTFTINIPTEMD